MKSKYTYARLVLFLFIMGFAFLIVDSFVITKEVKKENATWLASFDEKDNEEVKHATKEIEELIKSIDKYQESSNKKLANLEEKNNELKDSLPQTICESTSYYNEDGNLDTINKCVGFEMPSSVNSQVKYHLEQVDETGNVNVMIEIQDVELKKAFKEEFKNGLDYKKLQEKFKKDNLEVEGFENCFKEASNEIELKECRK